MLEDEFDVVEATARGLNLINTFTFEAVVMDELSGVFERVETESYQALRALQISKFPVIIFRIEELLSLIARQLNCA